MPQPLPPEESFIYNGVNGSTGRYLGQPSDEALFKALSGKTFGNDNETQGDLDARTASRETSFGPMAGIDPTNLGQSGWAVLFAHADREKIPAIKQALQPLLKLRASQAGEFFRVYDSGDGLLRPKDSKRKWLVRQGTGPGQPADPAIVPYYILLVGSPQSIPFRFQYQLSIEYAVGRIHFETLEAYAQYAENVVSAETGGLKLPKRALFFGTDNDRATQRSASELLQPLQDKLDTSRFVNGWQLDQLIGQGKATKSNLISALGGQETPSLLFTATHGVGFDLGDSRQIAHQGALLCQNWTGPAQTAHALDQNLYVAADDIPSDANMLGSMVFNFACYSAGTPTNNSFPKRAGAPREQIAPHDMLAKLPLRMLNRGALAVIGHTDRAWTTSFSTGIGAFQASLTSMMAEVPIGHAAEFIDDR